MPRTRRQRSNTYPILLHMTSQNSPQWGSEIGERMHWIRDISTLIRPITIEMTARFIRIHEDVLTRLFESRTAATVVFLFQTIAMTMHLRLSKLLLPANCCKPFHPRQKSLTKSNTPWTRLVMLPLVYFCSQHFKLFMLLYCEVTRDMGEGAYLSCSSFYT